MDQAVNESSLKYWEERWGKKAPNDEGTWPDAEARHLELLYLEEALKRILLRTNIDVIVELGCGEGHAIEAIRPYLQGRQYWGYDGCETALDEARKRAKHPACVFDRWDPMRDGCLCIPKNALLLTKRFLQNLNDLARDLVLRQLDGRFAAFISIEDHRIARVKTDELRRLMFNRPPLSVAPFNYPLLGNDRALLMRTVTGSDTFTFPPMYAFMGHYYAESRVDPLARTNGAASLGYRRSAAAICAGLAHQPFCGPVIGFSYAKEV